MTDLIERLRIAGDTGTGMRSNGCVFGILHEAADRIAALEAEASEGERRGLERAIALVEDIRLADRGEGASYASVHNKACSRIANGLRALILEAPAREGE